MSSISIDNDKVEADYKMACANLSALGDLTKPAKKKYKLTFPAKNIIKTTDDSWSRSIAHNEQDKIDHLLPCIEITINNIKNYHLIDAYKNVDKSLTDLSNGIAGLKQLKRNYEASFLDKSLQQAKVNQAILNLEIFSKELQRNLINQVKDSIDISSFQSVRRSYGSFSQGDGPVGSVLSSVNSLWNSTCAVSNSLIDKLADMTLNIKKDFILNYVKEKFEHVQPESCMEILRSNSNVYVLINKLVAEQGTFLTDSNIMVYGEFLQEKREILSFCCLVEGIIGSTYRESVYPSKLVEQYIEEQETIPELLFIPFIYFSTGVTSISHITLITIDTKDKKIYYYDSQGVPFDAEVRVNALPCDLHLDIEFEKIAKKYFEIEDPIDLDAILVQNKIVHQTDVHNCGVFVLKVMRELVLGHDFDAIMGGLSSTIQRQKGYSFREELGKELIDYYINEEVGIIRH
ncbi:MAG: Ulp1 protease family, C-terminal catalytic domain [Chlamydiales bacterium]|nr:Ulp1 protease family, C-terminal catalytic domain [Chlamydiales bacterium]